MSLLSNNLNSHKSIPSRTSNIKSNSPHKFQKVVKYKDNGKRVEQMTPIKKVTRFSSESSSVNSIPGLDWDSQVMIIPTDDNKTLHVILENINFTTKFFFAYCYCLFLFLFNRSTMLTF